MIKEVSIAYKESLPPYLERKKIPYEIINTDNISIDEMFEIVNEKVV
jgi:hypothetical protein